MYVYLDIYIFYSLTDRPIENLLDAYQIGLEKISRLYQIGAEKNLFPSKR